MDGETPLFDGLGSERTVTNSSQSVTASLTLSAFGQTVASSGSSTSPYQFGATSGYRTEGDAGLTLVGCRFYDSQVGRFITRDTYLNQAPYAYCKGDPVNAVDPSGHAGEGGSGLGNAINGPLGAVAALVLAARTDDEYLNNPNPSKTNDVWDGIGECGVGGAIIGGNAAIIGAGLCGSSSLAVALGGAALVTGGASIVIVGVAIAAYAGGKYEGWW